MQFDHNEKICEGINCSTKNPTEINIANDITVVTMVKLTLETVIQDSLPDRYDIYSIPILTDIACYHKDKYLSTTTQ